MIENPTHLRFELINLKTGEQKYATVKIGKELRVPDGWTVGDMTPAIRMSQR